jgi:hypothetical protein
MPVAVVEQVSAVAGGVAASGPEAVTPAIWLVFMKPAASSGPPASLFHQGEQAPAAVASVLSQLVQRRELTPANVETVAVPGRAAAY